MKLFSTCADPRCPEPLMRVTWVGQSTHPTCQQTAEEIKLREFVDAAQRGDEEAANELERQLNAPKAPPSMGSAALWYAKVAKWPVFPLFSPEQAERLARRRGVPVNKVAKLPALPSAHPDGDPIKGVCKGECGKLGHGLYDATTDERQVREWWNADPNYGIGVATGHAFDVIDIDGKTGYRSIMELGDDVFPPIHGKVHTTREDCGEHWYIPATGDGNRANVKPGLDYRGRGGYVCVPPTTIDGRRYSWVVQPSPEIYGKAS